MKKINSLLCLIAAIIFVAVLAIRMYVAQGDILRMAERQCSEGTAVILDEKARPMSLTSVLMSHGYIQNEDEATFISNHLIQKIRSKDGGRPESLKDLSKSKYGLELDSIGFSSISRFPYLSSMAEKLAGGHGVDPSMCPLPNKVSSKQYTVVVREENGWSLHRDTVFLRIREHYNVKDTIDGKVINCVSKDSVLAWIPVCGKTKIWLPEQNAQGLERYYSIIPVERGYVFGSERGTYKHHRNTFKFVRRRATLSLLGRDLLKRVREDNSILVRSPQEYRDKFISTIAIWGVLWILSFFLLSLIDQKRKGNSNLELLAIVALLSGIGLVNLFNLQNPVWGELVAWSQLTKGFIIGTILLMTFSFVDWTGLYIYSNKKHLESGRQSTQGLWMAIAAIGTLILLLFGSGPGGTRVCLPLIPIQGSPLIKILVIGYMAVFFASRGDLIEAYSKPGKLKKQMAILLAIIIVFALLGVIQLVISDLGPYLVLALTAVFMWSLYTDKKETIPMLIITGVFGAMMLVFNHMGMMDYPILSFSLLFVFVIGWSLFSHSMYKIVMISPIILCLVVFLSINGGEIFTLLGQDDIANRLNGRAAIAASPFDNSVKGGDQMAAGVWAITRGGLWGSPNGGLAYTVPAGHTDLAFESLIENTGVIGAVIVLLCLSLLLITSLKIGIRSGHPFSFTLASLIASSIGIQAVIIILGSLSIIPLSGITLPFISYGGTSLAIDMACVGILLSLSRKKDIELETQNTRRFEKVAKAQLWAFSILAVLAMSFVVNYGVISRKDYLVKTGKFINKSGERIPQVNPVIKNVKDQLISGDIFDCKGRVLAETDADGNRNYPYGDYTIFTLFNANTKLLWGTAGKNPSGLGAEEKYAKILRGFDTKPEMEIIKSHYHYAPFLPDEPLEREDTVIIEDNSTLMPLMLSKKKLREWNDRKAERSLQLTIDADLQMGLSDGAAQFVQRAKVTRATTDRTRVGIVIYDAADGGLLCSAMYPLANQDTLKNLALSKRYVYKDWEKSFKAYIDRDLSLVPLQPGSTAKTLTAGAAVKMGLASEIIRVYDDEIIDTVLGEPIGDVDLMTALIHSSNIYFIKLLNLFGEKLYPILAELYYSVGAKFGGSVPYTLSPDEVITSEKAYTDKVISFGRVATDKFSRYLESGMRHKLNDWEYQPSWGMGQLEMTPLSLARYVAAIANDGKMMQPRYMASDSVKVYKELFTEEEAHILQTCMKGQAAGKFGEMSKYMAGKTGTPERVSSRSGATTNDALYCFYIESAGTMAGHPLSVVIRLERVNGNSGLAMQMAREVVLPILKENGYIN